MSERRTVTAAARHSPERVQLQPLGLGALAEQVYAHLLRVRCASTRDLVSKLRAEPGTVDRAVAELTRTGLVRAVHGDLPGYASRTGVGPSGDAEVRYTAQPPMSSLGNELRDRVVQLVGAGAAIEELGDLYARKTAPASVGSGVATVADGFRAVGEAAHDLLVSTRRELLALDRQPFVRSACRPALAATMFDVLRRGVDVRTIYAADTFRVAGYADYMAELTRLGERARMLAHLPLRFVVADRTVAMLPLEADGPWVSAALVVRGPELVESLVQVFDELWDRGAPSHQIGPGGDAGGGDTGSGDGGGADHGDVTDDEVTLLRMLADDMTEGAIGRYLGASTRTVGRRLARLQGKLGAQNRFALGVEAARRGLL